MEEIPMKRLALVLAAAVLGTGCVVVDDDCAPSSITVSWSFLGWDNVVRGCGAAGVDWVDVYMNGALVGNGSPCTDGYLVITSVPSGTHDFMVEGLEPSGYIAYRDEFSVQSSGCGGRSVAALPAEGTANLDYTVSGCISSPCFLWFAVTDTIANVVAAAVSDTSPAAVKDDFPYPNDVLIRLAAGTYSLDWMQLVSSSYTHEAITCSPAAFTVAGAVTTNVGAPLQATCP
jgi:hypothetical protein